MNTEQKIRKNKVWSANSTVFHERSCSAVKRISAENLKEGTAPQALDPHDCVELNDRVKTQLQSFDKIKPPQNSTSKRPRPVSAINTSLDPDSRNPKSMSISHKNTQGSKNHNDHMNPFCRCDPCNCSAPCVCGLKKTETTTQTRWDAGEQVLKHVVTDYYQPDLHALMKNDFKSDTNHSDFSHQSERHLPVKTMSIDAALDALNDSEERKVQVAQKYQAIDQHNVEHQHKATIRTESHKGHQIELRTSYELYINGNLLNLHIAVMQDGQVHCHSIPNYSSASGIDLIKTLIDAFPDDYPPNNIPGVS